MNAPEPRRRPFWMTDRIGPRHADVLVFVACLALSLAAAFALLRPAHFFSSPDLDWRALAMVPFCTVPLLWRRSHPAIVLAVIAVAFDVSLAFGSLVTIPGLLCAAYAAALYGSHRTRAVAGFACVAALVAVFVLVLTTENVRLHNLAHVALVGYAVAWVLGDRARARRAYVGELEDTARRLERERDERARLAAEEERARIARELHDVVAHNVSVIAVQAGAGRATSKLHPERAEDTFGLIERTARTTLSELRSLLGVLRRGEGGERLRRPAPSLQLLDELVDQARAASLHVEATIIGRERPLDALTDLCAYRIIQEALTNAVKHAPGANVKVRVRHDPDELRVEVVDDGKAPPVFDGAGQGLTGMQERVALLGGELVAGPARGGGFRVAARLPLAAVQAGEPARDEPARGEPA